MAEGGSNSGHDQTVTCPACNKVYRWKDELANRSAKCKGCGRLMRFPPRAEVMATLVENPPPLEGAVSNTPPLVIQPPKNSKSAAIAAAKKEAALRGESVDDAMYDVAEHPSDHPRPVQSITPDYASAAPPMPRYPSTSYSASRAHYANDSRWNFARVSDEPAGLYVLRIISLILNGLLAGCGLISLLLCNPCTFVTGASFGIANLFWLVQGWFDGGQRVISIVVNAFGLIVGLFFAITFLLVSVVPVYTNVNMDPRKLLMIMYLPFGSLMVLACLTGMLYACIRRSE